MWFLYTCVDGVNNKSLSSIANIEVVLVLNTLSNF